MRTTPKEIFYTIIKSEGKKTTVITSSKLNIPLSMELPEKLSFVRKTFIDIIAEYKATSAGIRVSESNAQKLSIERISYEAVLQELLTSSTIETYFVGQISTISSKIGFKRDQFKKFISGELSFDAIEEWEKYKENQKESILVAVAALKL